MESQEKTSEYKINVKSESPYSGKDKEKTLYIHKYTDSQFDIIRVIFSDFYLLYYYYIYIIII